MEVAAEPRHRAGHRPWGGGHGARGPRPPRRGPEGSGPRGGRRGVTVTVSLIASAPARGPVQHGRGRGAPGQPPRLGCAAPGPCPGNLASAKGGGARPSVLRCGAGRAGGEGRWDGHPATLQQSGQRRWDETRDETGGLLSPAAAPRARPAPAGTTTAGKPSPHPKLRLEEHRTPRHLGVPPAKPPRTPGVGIPGSGAGQGGRCYLCR